ncbi:hypothetical protein DFH09DRAFT_1079824 [Mycena vulgaris]|nr:hypothetical protein DFH09DRAFT_1079824 [Mycena vulgaris]
MSNSSTPATSSRLFRKRRRAFVACLNCRKRKLRKGIKCEYFSVTDEDDYSSFHPGTSSPDPQDAFQRPIILPSAKLAEYLRPGSAPEWGASGTPEPYSPYRQQPWPDLYRPHGMYFPESSTKPEPSHPVPHTSGHMQDPGRSGPQLYNAGPNQQPSPYSSPPHIRVSYNANAAYDQADVPQVQADASAYQWPQGALPRYIFAHFYNGDWTNRVAASEYILGHIAWAQLRRH